MKKEEIPAKDDPRKSEFCSQMHGDPYPPCWNPNHSCEDCRNKWLIRQRGVNQLQMTIHDHRNDDTLYAKFKDILRAIQVMSGYSKSVGWSQYMEDSKSRFYVSLNIDDEDNINIELELRKVKNE